MEGKASKENEESTFFAQRTLPISLRHLKLMDLPQELREAIFSLLIVRPDSSVEHHHPETQNFIRLTLVSKQIYTEVHYIVFSKHRFVIPLGNALSSVDPFTIYESVMPLIRKFQFRRGSKTIMSYSRFPQKQDSSEMDLAWNHETLTARIEVRHLRLSSYIVGKTHFCGAHGMVAWQVEMKGNGMLARAASGKLPGMGITGLDVVDIMRWIISATRY